MNVPIKVTTDYTLLSSLINLDKLFSFAKENNILTVGICDENLFGSFLFYKKCISNDIKPLIGLDVIINDKHIYLYAKNYNGFKDLLKLSNLKEDREITLFDLTKINKDIIYVVPYESREFAKEFKSYDLYVSYENNDEKKNILLTDYKNLYLRDIRVVEKEDCVYLNYLKLVKK